jgi:hypothetical protein
MNIEFSMNRVPDEAIVRVLEQLRAIVDATTHYGSSISVTFEGEPR